jgi:hypothetical protein
LQGALAALGGAAAAGLAALAFGGSSPATGQGYSWREHHGWRHLAQPGEQGVNLILLLGVQGLDLLHVPGEERELNSQKSSPNPISLIAQKNFR